jgi:hypothetical protein
MPEKPKADPLANFLTFKMAKSQMEVSEEKELKKLSNHIIVCGIHSSLYHFILPLRAAYLKNYL